MSKPDLPRLNLRNPFIDSESSSTELAKDDSSTAGSAGDKRGGKSTSDKLGRTKKSEPSMVQRPRAGTWNAVSPSSFSANQTTVSQSLYNDPARSFNLNPKDGEDGESDHAASDESSGPGDGDFDPTSADLPWMTSDLLPLPDGSSVSSPRWTPRSPTNMTTLNNTHTTTTTATAPVTITTTTTTTLATTDLMTTTKTSSTENSKPIPLEGKSSSKGNQPTIPKLQLPRPSGPDPTEVPKSSRTARGHKNSSDLLKQDASKLRSTGKMMPDLRLPEFRGMSKVSLPKSESLAAQLVISESKWFQETLNSSKADTMLRGTVYMKTPPPTDEELRKKENVIEQLLQPFMRYHIAHSKIPTLLQQIKANYENGVAKQAIAAYENLIKANEVNPTKKTKFVDDPTLKALLGPLIQPLIEYMKGKAGELKTWGYPAPILNLLLHLSDWTLKWQEANSKLDPESFKTARLNALKAFASTRSFMTDFTLELNKSSWGTIGTDDGIEQEDKKDADYYMPLLSFLNSSITKELEAFLNIIIDAPAETRELLQHMADVVELNAKKSDADTEKQLNESRDKVLKRKPKLATQLKDVLFGRGKEGSAVQPQARLRRAGTFNAKAPGSSGDKPTAVQTERASGISAFQENSVFLASQKNRKRAVKLDAYVKELKSKVFGGKIDAKSFVEWGDIIGAFNKKIQDYAREEFNTFINNRHQVFLDFLNEFKTQRSLHDKTPTDDLWTLIRYLENQVELQDKQAAKEKEAS